MDAIALILQALEAGTAPDVGTLTMVPDDIINLDTDFTALLASKFADTATGQAILEQYISAPDLYEGPLVQMLEEEGIDRDAEVIGAAQSLLETHDVHGARRGNYTVEFDDEELDNFV